MTKSLSNNDASKLTTHNTVNGQEVTRSWIEVIGIPSNYAQEDSTPMRLYSQN